MRRFSSGMAAALLCCAAAIFLTACKAGDGAGSGRAAANSAAADARTAATTSTPTAGATPHATSTPGDGVRRITVTEARQAMESGGALMVDVRGAAEYNRGHIKGSMLLPKAEIAARAKELPRDRLIITYCA